MARTELAFWLKAGALRREEIKRVGREFWEKHGAAITAPPDFATSHALLLSAAASDLLKNPIRNPAATIEAARAASGVDRWPGLMPSTQELVLTYFPACSPTVG
jgi:hypothetical protein